MKNINDLNINNLTTLWTKVGQMAGNYKKATTFEISTVDHAQWPNKIWTEKSLSEQMLKELAEQLLASEIELILPLWNSYTDGISKIISDSFVQKSEQTGMSLKLAQIFNSANSLSVKRVSEQDDIRLWSTIYPACFGYLISAETLSRTKDEITYYLFYGHNQPVGTAIYFRTGDVVGIHGVGVLPEMRKRGFAEEIMKILLNKAFLEGISYATLQASPLGKGVYSRLGFTEDFTIKNYGTKTNLTKLSHW